MEEIVKRIKAEYNFPPAVIEELTTIIEAWEGINMSEQDIVVKLEQYSIYLKNELHNL